ncbi:hypothetical protein C0Q70_11809 [Pomacea canaliculata]|uniref:Uncharacterized protein n=1 Tax=Pomacea canaliculata TaxID=400727 RepID=A0A2T7P708_POMCA|nr:hypothetical protein C0Q70_11809 [Pomacea canaliculata]
MQRTGGVAHTVVKLVTTGEVYNKWRFSSDYTDYAESEKKKSGGQDETTFTIPNKADAYLRTTDAYLRITDAGQTQSRSVSCRLTGLEPAEVSGRVTSAHVTKHIASAEARPLLPLRLPSSFAAITDGRRVWLMPCHSIRSWWLGQVELCSYRFLLVEVLREMDDGACGQTWPDVARATQEAWGDWRIAPAMAAAAATAAADTRPGWSTPRSRTNDVCPPCWSPFGQGSEPARKTASPRQRSAARQAGRWWCSTCRAAAGGIRTRAPTRSHRARRGKLAVPGRVGSSGSETLAVGKKASPRHGQGDPESALTTRVSSASRLAPESPDLEVMSSRREGQARRSADPVLDGGRRHAQSETWAGVEDGRDKEGKRLLLPAPVTPSGDDDHSSGCSFTSSEWGEVTPTSPSADTPSRRHGHSGLEGHVERRDQSSGDHSSGYLSFPKRSGENSHFPNEHFTKASHNPPRSSSSEITVSESRPHTGEGRLEVPVMQVHVQPAQEDPHGAKLNRSPAEQHVRRHSSGRSDASLASARTASPATKLRLLDLASQRALDRDGDSLASWSGGSEDTLSLGMSCTGLRGSPEVAQSLAAPTGRRPAPKPPGPSQGNETASGFVGGWEHGPSAPRHRPPTHPYPLHNIRGQGSAASLTSQDELLRGGNDLPLLAGGRTVRQLWAPLPVTDAGVAGVRVDRQVRVEVTWRDSSCPPARVPLASGGPVEISGYSLDWIADSIRPPNKCRKVAA